ncbi:MAG: Flp pilus assembly complex ATPase component TadA [Deltaproteobacteria bacterium]|nr:Flp pilus assembly complex ATPase component TadA [Deltaproteobacteria bacterium]
MTAIDGQRRKKLGDLLVDAGLITKEQLEFALKMQKETGKRFGQILVEKKIITEDVLENFLGQQLGIPHVWLRKGLVDPKIVNILPKEKAILYQVIPMFKIKNRLIIATADPQAIFTFDTIAKITGCELDPVVCRAIDIMEAIEENYGMEEDVKADEFLSNIEESEIELLDNPIDKDYQSISGQADESPIINLVNMILLKSVKSGASDIHIEPERNIFRVRYRIDGVLYQTMTSRIDLFPAVVSRLKIMANLDIAERRQPQDGRIQVKAEGRMVDLRFSSLPGVCGEKLVLRILDQNKSILDINSLGFYPDQLDSFKKALRSSFGLILVTGPTGSGKTTTLYSAINMLNTLEKNIITIEDPVEYNMEIINQMQTHDAIGLTFARILKHTLRQDPDIILVGEIRDKETAEIAIQASLTGHLVLSTLHTNDSPGVIARLINMGIEPSLISSSLTAILAQRLIRTICPECKTLYYPSKPILKTIGMEGNRTFQLSKGEGCSACYDSGYKGRVGIYEFLNVDSDFQKLILEGAGVTHYRKLMVEKGVHTLREEALKKVREGVSTLEEANRAVLIED